jgi:periplasmic copper chaperone A
MHRTRAIAGSLAIALLLSACSTADAPGPDGRAAAATAQDEAPAGEPAAAPEVHDARSRMSPKLAAAAAVYLEIDNPSDHDEVLVAASVAAEVAARAELHETYEVDEVDEDDGGEMGGSMHGGGDDAAAPMMAMREIPSIAIPAGGTIELVPGGLHIMLLDLVDDLEPGATFELTLEFERAGPVVVSVDVREDV